VGAELVKGAAELTAALPVLELGLPAGADVDRLRARPVLDVLDLVLREALDLALGGCGVAIGAHERGRG
jgi:hypothetical protein